MKVMIIIGLVMAIAIGVSACGTTTNNSPAPVGDASSAVSAVTPEDLVDQNPGVAQMFCTNYFSLVNQGWNNETIYSELDAAGTFDGWDFDTKAIYEALIRWCYNND